MAFSYKRSITIDHTKCGVADSANFTVYVSITDNTFKLIAGGGHVTDASGFDIIFTSDSAGTTKVPWEIESYDGTNGILKAWVLCANVTFGSDAVFYVFYGDATITTAQNVSSFAPTLAWDTNHKAVYHLGDGTTLSLNDSTVNAKTLGNFNTVVAADGQIRGGANFNGLTNFLYIPATPITAPPLTFSAWIKATVLAGSVVCIVWTSGNDDWIRLGLSPVVFADDNALGGTGYHSVTGTTVLSTGVWYHLAAIFNPSGLVLTVFVNGVLEGTGVYVAPSNIDQLNIGVLNRITRIDYFSGIIDEVRVSASVRSASWLLAEYNNQFAPGNIGTPGFLTFGSETSLLTSALSGAYVKQFGSGASIKGGRGF